MTTSFDVLQGKRYLSASSTSSPTGAKSIKNRAKDPNSAACHPKAPFHQQNSISFFCFERYVHTSSQSFCSTRVPTCDRVASIVPVETFRRQCLLDLASLAGITYRCVLFLGSIRDAHLLLRDARLMFCRLFECARVLVRHLWHNWDCKQSPSFVLFISVLSESTHILLSICLFMAFILTK